MDRQYGETKAEKKTWGDFMTGRKRSCALIVFMLLVLFMFGKTAGISAAATGWQTKNGEKVFILSDGSRADGLAKVGNDLYYFQNGIAKTGWRNINGKLFYFSPDTGKALKGGLQIAKGAKYIFTKEQYLAGTGFVQVDGKIYYAKNGRPGTGLAAIGQDKYYFRDGIISTGWKKLIIGGKEYMLWFDPETGKAVSGIKNINGTNYLFYKSNVLAGTGFASVAGRKYYTKNGIIPTGFIKVNGNLYYSAPEGLKEGFWTIKMNGRNETYYFYPGTNQMAADVTINGRYFSSEGNEIIDVKTGAASSQISRPSSKEYTLQASYNAKAVAYDKDLSKDRFVVYKLYVDDTKETITDFRWTVINNFTTKDHVLTGNKKIIIVSGDNRSTSITMPVYPYEIPLSSISVKSEISPFEKDHIFKKSDFTVEAVWADNTSENVTDFEFTTNITINTAEDPETGSCTAVITYEGKTGTVTIPMKPVPKVYDIQVLMDQLSSQLPRENGKWAVYVGDLSTGSSASLGNSRMLSASLIKLYVMGAVYEKYDSLAAAYGSADLDEYLEQMITISDNYATDVLVNYLGDGDYRTGMAAVNNYCQRNGYAETFMGQLLFHHLNETYNYTSVRDCGLFLTRVYQVSRGLSACPVPGAASMFRLLSAQTRRHKIPSQLPGVSIANKTGELSTAENDAAIIYNSKHDLVICFMSMELDHPIYAQAAIGRMSKYIYDYFNKN